MIKEFDKKIISEIEKTIGYSFKNKKLLETAFTHSSFSNESEAENNEKLEFLGDSLLNFIVAEFLYGTLEDEGTLTTARAKIVSATPLARAVERLGLARFLRAGAGVMKENLSQKFYSNIFEAVIGAIYLDGGINECKVFASNNLEFEGIKQFVDYKTKLQEYVQRRDGTNQIVYKEEFDKTRKLFLCNVFIFGKPSGNGEGVRKKIAQQEAARIALENLGINL